MSIVHRFHSTTDNDFLNYGVWIKILQFIDLSLKLFEMKSVDIKSGNFDSRETIVKFSLNNSLTDNKNIMHLF